jgi:hypothetical protein
MLTDELANPAGYVNAMDTFRMTHYPVYGASEDWLHKERGTLAAFVETYSVAEGRVGTMFYPLNEAEAMVVAEHNYDGALGIISNCPH